LESDNFRLSEFIAAVQRDDYDRIHARAQREIYEAGRRVSPRSRVPKGQTDPAKQYIEQLKALVFFMQTLAVPAGAPWVAEACRPLVENLVARGQFRSSALDVCNTLSPRR
jgi:hypothetical protein